jgi:hypothetical protein
MFEKEVIGPGIVAYKNALPKDWNLIDRLEASLTKEESPFKWQGSKVGYFESNLDHRNCQDFKYTKETLGDSNEHSQDLLLIHDQVHGSLRACLDDYGRDYQVRVEWIGAFNMVKYGPGEKFNAHSDDGEPYRCTISAVGYINDDYVGGELYFNHFDLTYTPRAGDFVIFPSSYIYSHASIPVTEGVKYATVVMTDRSSFAHFNDSPVYYTVEERENRGLSTS